MKNLCPLPAPDLIQGDGISSPLLLLSSKLASPSSEKSFSTTCTKMHGPGLHFNIIGSDHFTSITIKGDRPVWVENIIESDHFTSITIKEDQPVWGVTHRPAGVVRPPRVQLPIFFFLLF
jgi:hypothetical protein